MAARPGRGKGGRVTSGLGEEEGRWGALLSGFLLAFPFSCPSTAEPVLGEGSCAPVRGSAAPRGGAQG